MLSLYENTDVTGADYACFKIYELARRAISTRGIQAISSAVWSANDISEYSIWLLIGTPSNCRDLKNKQVHKLYATIGLEPVDGIPAGFNQEKHKRLYAKLVRSSIGGINKEFDIDGMSGGPIFGLKPSTLTSSNQYEYRVIGIQSHATSTHIAFCAARPFIEIIAHCNAM